jgi:hypothetical protein
VPDGSGKLLVVIGLGIAGIGVLVLLGGKIPWLGNLPGDIRIQREQFSFYFPLTTGILVSIVLSVILWLLRR